MGCDSQYKDSVQLFIEQIDVIKRLANDYPNDLKFVTDAAGKESISSSAKNGQLRGGYRFSTWSLKFSFFSGLESAFQEHRIGSIIGVESGHAIGSSLGVLRTLYELGARYMTLTHSCNTPWYDYWGHNVLQSKLYIP